MKRVIRSAAIGMAMATIACTPTRAPDPEQPRQPVAETATILTFTATVDVEAGKMTIVPDGPGGTSGALTAIPVVQDGAPWSGPPGTVELVTTAVRMPGQSVPCDALPSLEADVYLNSFIDGIRLRNAHVELLSMTPTGRESCNSSPAFDGHSDANGGFWSYGDVEPATIGANVATWRLKLPSTANFTFKGRVVADAYTAAGMYPFLGWYVPTCVEKGSACDSGALVDGRGYNLKGEYWPPSNTWGCYDGESGGYHTEESLDRLAVRAVDGPVIAAEKALRVEATVWVADPLVDVLDLYLNPDPADSAQYGNWTPVATLVPSGPGAQVLTAQLTLPVGGPHQAIRGVFRRGGTSAVPCSQGEWDDTDDLAFAVDNSQVFETIPPMVQVYSDYGTWLTGTVPIRIDGSDNSGVVTGQLLVDGRPVGSPIPLPGQVDLDTTLFGNGEHFLSAVARDPSGNEATSDPFGVWMDNGPAGDRTPPTMYLYAQASAGGTVPVWVEGWDDYTPVTGQLSVDGAPIGSPAELPFEVQLDTTALSDGVHTLVAHGWDPNGNEGTSEPFEMTVDNTAPGVTITAPLDGAEVGPAFVARASIDDPTATYVTYLLDGQWAASASYPPWPVWIQAGALAPGPHVLTAETVDAAGNTGTSPPVTVVLLPDSGAPTVSWGSVVDGRVVKPSGSVYSVVNSYDAYGVSRIELWADGAFYWGQDGKPANVTWTAPAVQGAHTLQLRAFDAAGNTGVSSVATVTVDGTPPTGSFLAPAPDAVVSDDVLLQIDAGDDVRVARVDFYAGYELVGSDDAAPWEGTWDSGTVDNGTAVALRARVVDAAGNSVDVSGPTVTSQNAWLAVGDPEVQGWLCSGRNAKCGTGTVFDGRDWFLREWQPSTLDDSCPDGTVAESSLDPLPYVESIRLATVGGEPLDAGRPVRATVVAWGDSTKQDKVDLYYATDAMVPIWTFVGTRSFVYGTWEAAFTFDWTLASENPNGIHAVRAVARRGGTAAACTTGDHDDHDDVAFEVGDHQPPVLAITSPAPGATLSGLVPVTFDVADESVVATARLSSNSLIYDEIAGPPWAFTLDTRRLPNGPQVLGVSALDTLGNYGSSEGVPVTVVDPVTELIVNGGFESGHIAWTETPPGGVIDAGVTYPAAAGSWKAVLGGTGIAGTSSLCQTVTVPASAQRVELGFRILIETAETEDNRDSLLIDFKKPDGTWIANYLLFYNQYRYAYPEYWKIQSTATSLRGQDVRVCFTATEDSGEPTAFLFDDVTLWWK